MKTDITIVGAGAAGLSSVLGAYDENLNITLIEREDHLGGILNQCIHNGFGLHLFKEELTGPEYASRLASKLEDKKINLCLNTTVVDIKKENDEFILTLTSLAKGIHTLISKAVIITSGCYERTKGAIMLPGERPKGILTAGSAQRYLNIDGYLVGKRVFILGSGDIGLIMARRMTLEGAKVLGVAEIMPYSNGLTRNVVQCLHDFDIPLYLSHTVTNVKGKDALEGITIQQVDENFNPIEKTQKEFEVDTLLLSVGLIPDIGLFDSLGFKKSNVTKSAIVNQRLETNISGLFVCGNALHVHDLVDFASIEGEKAGKYAKEYVKKLMMNPKAEKEIILKDNIRYCVPQLIDYNNLDDTIVLSFRVSRKMEKGIFRIMQGNEIIKQKSERYIAPSEMVKMEIKPSELKSNEPLMLSLEEMTS